MAKRKWYVVTVGKDVGVFTTWLEAGPLVKGVPDALHQSFSTFEEASTVFAQEQTKGRTRIVGGGMESRSNVPHRNSGHSDTRTSVGNESFESSLFINTQYRDSPRYAPASVRLIEGRTYSTPSSPGPQFVCRSDSRLDIIDSFFPNEAASAVGARSPVTANIQNVASPPSTLTNSLTNSTGSSSTPRAVVRTPPWVASYPRAATPSNQSNQPLSPLDSPSLLLRSFQQYSPPQARPRTTISRQSGVAGIIPQNPSTPETSLYRQRRAELSPGSIVVNEHNAVDPRSPIINRSAVPELIYTNSLLLSRPSPSQNTARLPFEGRQLNPHVERRTFRSNSPVAG